MIGITLSFSLLFLAGLHVYYAAGGQWGQKMILGGSPDPGPIAKLAVATLLVVGSAVAAARVKLLRVPVSDRVIRVMLYGMAIAFVGVAVDNLFSRTILERFAFAPVAALLALATLILAAFR